MSETFELVERGGFLLVRCKALDAVPGISHAFSTVIAGGAARLDLGTADSSDPRVLAGRERFLAAAGFGTSSAAVVRQVHGARIVGVSDTASIPEADGVLWTRAVDSRRVPAVRTADCVPILLADRKGRAAAALHAGWRGTAAGVAAEGVAALAAAGIPPGELVAALGPSIRACCYEVGPDVARALAASVSSGREREARPRGAGERSRVDLHALNRAQLVEAGVPGDAVHSAPWCTRCRADLFHSHRRDGEAAGRMMACIGAAATALPRRDP